MNEAGTYQQSMITGNDGSYAFAVPGADLYRVYTDVQEPFQVNVPAQEPVAPPGEFIPMPFDVTYQGAPVKGFDPGTAAAHFAPWTASGDFYGDGYISAATLGTAPAVGGSGTELLLVIYRGAATPDQVTVDVQPLGPYNAQADPDTVPSVFWGNGRLLLVPRTLGQGTAIRSYDPVTKSFATLADPQVAGLTDVVAVAPTSAGDALLITSSDGNNWALVGLRVRGVDALRARFVHVLRGRQPPPRGAGPFRLGAGVGGPHVALGDARGGGLRRRRGRRLRLPGGREQRPADDRHICSRASGTPSSSSSWPVPWRSGAGTATIPSGRRTTRP